MEFPTIVYRCPGPHWGPPGTTYESVGVDDEQQLLQRLADGWSESLADAAEVFLHPAPRQVTDVVVEPEVDDDAPPSRQEMLEQSERIGLKVDKRWSDTRLYGAILDHMKAQG